ncbi:MAG: hypothetical protein ACI884_001459 [Ulvibacter sp.]|jgi:hypothetical protein
METGIFSEKGSTFYPKILNKINYRYRLVRKAINCVVGKVIRLWKPKIY